MTSHTCWFQKQGLGQKESCMTLTISLFGFLLAREAGCDFDFLKGHCQNKNHMFYNFYLHMAWGLVG